MGLPKLDCIICKKKTRWIPIETFGSSVKIQCRTCGHIRVVKRSKKGIDERTN